MSIASALAKFVDTAVPSFRANAITQSPIFNTRPGMAHRQLAEVLIRYRMVGKGPQTLVLAVDPPVVIEQYDELISALENNFRVIVFESPGFGFSFPKSGFSFDFTFINNLIAKFLQRLSHGPYLLAFPCGMAYAAVDIAARFPELVSGVIAIQAPSWSEEMKWKHSRDKKGILATPIIGQLAMQLLKRKRAPKWLDLAVGKRELLPKFIALSDQALAHGACFCLASAFQHYLKDAPPALPAIKQPSLVVWGEADKSHLQTDKSSTHIYCQDAEDLRFKTAGHFPELEEPVLFAKHVIEWARIHYPSA